MAEAVTPRKDSKEQQQGTTAGQRSLTRSNKCVCPSEVAPIWRTLCTKTRPDPVVWRLSNPCINCRRSTYSTYLRNCKQFALVLYMLETQKEPTNQVSR